MSKQTITHQWVRGAEDGLWFVAVRVEEDGECWYRFPGSAGYYAETDVAELGPDLPNPGTKPVDARAQGVADSYLWLQKHLGPEVASHFETWARERFPDLPIKADNHD